jgi:putative FmdB family regulatory protein
MPIYEYQCASCGKKTEFIQGFSDPRPTICPHCGGRLKKLLSSPTAHFKGSGFHATDYAKPGSEAPKDSSKGDKESGGTEKKSDSAGESAKGESAKDSRKESSKESKRDGGAGAASGDAAPKTSNAPSKKTSDPK